MIIQKYIGWGLLFLLSIGASALVTYFFVLSQIDWNWAVFFNQNETFVYAAAPFVLLGMFVPLLIPAYFFLKYRKSSRYEEKQAFRSTFWTFVTAYLVMTILKVFTNRVDMEPFEPIGNIDISDQFRFGFMNSNSWWESFSEGWPSGHTMIAISMVISIYPFLKNKFAKIIHVSYAVLVALSVSTAFHWVSDVIAGALIGLVIGFYFKKRFELSEL